MGSKPNHASDGTTHHLTHRWDTETSVSERIVTAVAEYQGEDAAALPALAESINPEALDALFETPPESDVRPGCVTFSYYGYTVVVQSTGQILLRQN